MAGGDGAGVDFHGETDWTAAANVLLLAPSMSDANDGGCLDLFGPDDPEGVRVLGVSYTRTPDDWVEAWRERVDGIPSELVVVDVGGGRRSAAATSSPSSIAAGEATEVPVRPVESPEDLTGLGIALGKQLEAWSDGGPIVVCFDSLTVLLQYVDLQRAFRFLHVLTGRMGAAGARAHYHLDPTAVDDRTVATLTSLFDVTVGREDDEWTVRSR